MDWTSWAWVVVPLGVTRALQILLWDRITAPARKALQRRLNPEGLPMSDPRRPYLSYLVECPWCMSVWVGLLVVVAVSWDPTRPVALGGLAALSLSLVAVLLDRVIDRVLPDDPPPDPGPQVLVWPGDDDAPPYAVAAALDELTEDA